MNLADELAEENSGVFCDFWRCKSIWKTFEIWGSGQVIAKVVFFNTQKQYHIELKVHHETIISFHSKSFGEQTSDLSLPLQGFNITFRGVKWWVKRLNLHLFSWCCIIQGHKSFANPVVAEKFEMMEDDRTFWKWRLLQRKMILRKNRLVDRCVI